MATQGPFNPSTTVDDAAVGTFTWVNPNNAQVSDNIYATTGFTGVSYDTHYLKATNFGFSIPPGSTIDGITVEYERKATVAGTSFTRTLTIVKGGTFSGTSKTNIDQYWPTTDTFTSFGSSVDLWGTTWTATDINDPGFGVGLSAFNGSLTSNTLYIDNIRISVNYTPSPVAPTVTTQAANSITQTTATGNGNVTSDGGATITQRGVCWNTTGTPTTSDSTATSAGTTGAFTASMTGLSPNTLYYVRAYAINSVGTSYGSQVTFTTLAPQAQISNISSITNITSITI